LLSPKGRLVRLRINALVRAGLRRKKKGSPSPDGCQRQQAAAPEQCWLKNHSMQGARLSPVKK